MGSYSSSRAGIARRDWGKYFQDLSGAPAAFGSDFLALDLSSQEFRSPYEEPDPRVWLLAPAAVPSRSSYDVFGLEGRPTRLAGMPAKIFGLDPPPIEGAPPTITDAGDPALMVQGKRYLAKIQLTGLESTFGSKGAVRGKLEGLGFAQVVVYDKNQALPPYFPDRTRFQRGDTYWAEGTWSRSTAQLDRPGEIKEAWAIGAEGSSGGPPQSSGVFLVAAIAGIVSMVVGSYSVGFQHGLHHKGRR